MKKLLACGLILTMLSSTGAMCFANPETEINGAVQVVSTGVATTEALLEEKNNQKEELIKGLDEIKKDSSLTWKEKASVCWNYVKNFVRQHYKAIGFSALAVLACVFGAKFVSYVLGLIESNRQEAEQERLAREAENEFNSEVERLTHAAEMVVEENENLKAEKEMLAQGARLAEEVMVQTFENVEEAVAKEEEEEKEFSAAFARGFEAEQTRLEAEAEEEFNAAFAKGFEAEEAERRAEEMRQRDEERKLGEEKARQEIEKDPNIKNLRSMIDSLEHCEKFIQAGNIDKAQDAAADVYEKLREISQLEDPDESEICIGNMMAYGYLIEIFKPLRNLEDTFYDTVQNPLNNAAYYDESFDEDSVIDNIRDLKDQLKSAVWGIEELYRDACIPGRFEEKMGNAFRGQCVLF